MACFPLLSGSTCRNIARRTIYGGAQLTVGKPGQSKFLLKNRGMETRGGYWTVRSYTHYESGQGGAGRERDVTV